jgi:hypothetical protein
MIQKFARVPGIGIVQTLVLITILAGAATVLAQQNNPQQTPVQQPPTEQPQTQAQPDNQQSSSSQQSGSQEATPEETEHPHKPTHDFDNWNFNVGGGASFTYGTTDKFVRSGGGVAAAGVARNYNKYLGLRFDFQYDNLPLRTTSLQAAQTTSASSHVYTFTLDPIINVPVNKDWGGYVLIGPLFLHRAGKLDSTTAIPGYPCNSFFEWWGSCYNNSLPLNGDFLHANVNELGVNFGGGITRKIRSNLEFYAEFRYLHGSRNGITTDTRPLTIGVRW